MSYYPPQPQPMVYVNVEPQENLLGMFGLIGSVLSVFTCGAIAPIAFFMCLVACLYPPRGMAIIGLIISGAISLFFFLFGLTMILGILGLGAVGTAAVEAAQKAKAEREARERMQVVAPGLKPVAPIDVPKPAEAIESPIDPATTEPSPPPPAPAPAAPSPEEIAEAEKAAAIEREKAEAEKKAAADKAAGWREWTSAAGTKIEAKFRGMLGTKVRLERRDGSVITVEPSQLSPADNEWLKDRIK